MGRFKIAIVALVSTLALTFGSTVPAHAAATCTATQGVDFSSKATLQTWLNNAASSCPAAGDSAVVNFTTGFVLPSTITWAGAADLTFHGNGVGTTILDSNNVSGVGILNASSASGTVTIDSLTIQNSNVTNSGAVTVNGVDVFVTNSKFLHNAANRVAATANYGGGAIFSAGFFNSVTVTNSIFETNTAAGGAGGAIRAGSVSATGSTFTSNTATDLGGGAIYAAYGALSISGCTFTSNAAGSSGGGAILSNLNNATSVTITSTSFTNNSTTSNGPGGAVALNGTSGSKVLDGITASGNYAGGGGAMGGFLYSQSAVTINSSASGSNFTANGVKSDLSIVTPYGGAIYAVALTLNGSANNPIQFLDNRATDNGGAVVADNLTASFANFAGNQVGGSIGSTNAIGYGGAIYAEYPGTIALTNSKIVNNSAPNGTGGGIYAFQPSTTNDVTLDKVTISGNSATTASQTITDAWYGQTIKTTGGVQASGNVFATNSTFTGNTAGGVGAISTELNTGSNNVTLKFVTIGSNTGGLASAVNVGTTLLADASVIVGTCVGTVSGSGTFNISTSASCPGTVKTTGEINLGALATNSSGFSQTQLPGTGSVLIGMIPAGSFSSVTTDQNGSSRTGLGTVGAVFVSSVITYTATFNTQGGSSTSTVNFNSGGSLTLPAAPTLAGSTFNGWYTAASGGTLAGAAGASYTPGVTQNITLYAQWTLTPVPKPSPNGGNLPNTGANVMPILEIAGALAVLGGAFVVISKRRRSRKTDAS